jgi:RNA polymerase sigma factor (sigma-70 family)
VDKDAEDRPLGHTLDDERALFGALFDECAVGIYNYCFRRVGQWSVAEDLMSAVFLEAWRRRDEIELPCKELRPWLYGVANNLIRNLRRSLRRHQAALERLAALDAEFGNFADQVAARVDDEQRLGTVLNLIRRLPLRDQEILGTCSWSGLSYEEAALALRLPVGTVRSRLSRARRRLRELEASYGHVPIGRVVAREDDDEEVRK